MDESNHSGKNMEMKEQIERDAQRLATFFGCFALITAGLVMSIIFVLVAAGLWLLR